MTRKKLVIFVNVIIIIIIRKPLSVFYVYSEHIDRYINFLLLKRISGRTRLTN